MYFEKKHVHVKRNNGRYYSGWLSKDDIEIMLKDHHMKYGENVDITKYVDGERKTLNAEGRVYPAAVTQALKQGCSVRLLNPQAFHDAVWKMLAILQEHFGCFTGANAYLTPAGSQGFSPHFDDVDVFILQLEGSKHWKLYDPPEKSQFLARVSSKNFTQEEIGEPIAEVTLEAGDLLYLPRGTVHQAATSDSVHSLHLTVSAYQKNSWIDLLEKVIPQALQLAAESDIEFRRGLPRGYLHYMGVANQDKADDDEPEEIEEEENGERKKKKKKQEEEEEPKNKKERQDFISIAHHLVDTLKNYLPLDAAVDQMGKIYQHSALPPVLLPVESDKTVLGRKQASLILTDDIRLVRNQAFRIVVEHDILCVYFHSENSRFFQLTPPQVIEFSPDAGPALEFILSSYADGFIRVLDIPSETSEQKLDIANALYERGLIIVND